MSNLIGYIRQSSRMLFRYRRITLIAILGLALGIGLTTTMFSIVNGTVLRGMPFHGSDRIMYLDRHEVSGPAGQFRVTPHDYVDWKAQQSSFEDLAAFTRESFNLSGSGGPPERYEGSFISTNMFGLLGVRPELGRDFNDQDGRSGAEPVVMLSHTLWEKRFGRDKGIVNQIIRVNSDAVRVIGVMPPRFAFPLFQSAWMPLRLDPLPPKRGDGPSLEVIGPLKAGVSREKALADLDTIAKRLELTYPANKGIRAMVRPYIAVMLSEQAIALLYTMLGASLGVLIIACANVANLLLARASLRSREVAIRSSLGASRMHMISQFMAEAFVLSVLGGIAGLLLAGLAIWLFNRSIVGLNMPFWIHVGIDIPALVVVFGLMLLASVASGSFPALQASGANLSSLLKDQNRGTSSLRIGKLSRALVVIEVALSCGLLVASGLMVKSITNLRTLDFGFQTKQILTAEIALPQRDYPDDASRIRFFNELMRRLGERPEVKTAALVSTLPAVGAEFERFAVEGRAYPKDDDYPEAGLVAITPGFFDTFGTHSFQGRLFSTADDQTAAPSALVNQSFVRRFAAGQDLIGRRIRLGKGDSKNPWLTIVGVVPDMLVGPVRSTDQAGIYVPLAQHPQAAMDIALRTASEPGSLASVARDAVIAVDRNLPIYSIKPMEQVISDNNWFYVVFGSLFMAFGLMALILASIGLYGVMSFSVSRRTQEIGTRMALGASQKSVLSLILRQGMTQFIVGLVLGIAFALALSQLLQVLLVGVQPWDLPVFAVVVLVLAATGLLACFVPARAALRVDPVVTLKSD